MAYPSHFTYEDMIQADLDELKPLAATMRTYGDWWELEEAIKEQREGVRQTIRECDQEIRRLRQKIERWERRCRVRGYEDSGDVTGMYRRWIEQRQARRAACARVRDELTEALRYGQAQQRHEEKELARITAEWKAERERDEAQRCPA